MSEVVYTERSSRRDRLTAGIVALSLIIGGAGGAAIEYSVNNHNELSGRIPDQVHKVAKKTGQLCTEKAQTDFNKQYPKVSLDPHTTYDAQHLLDAYHAEKNREDARNSFIANKMADCVNTNLVNPANEDGQNILHTATTVATTTTTNG